MQIWKRNKYVMDDCKKVLTWQVLNVEIFFLKRFDLKTSCY